MLSLFKRKESFWLFTDWTNLNKDFTVYTSFKDFKYINSRTVGSVQSEEWTYWFNIDDIKREIKNYEKKYNIKLKGFKETIKDIQKCGFCYSDKNIEETKKLVEEKNKQGIKIKMI